MALASLRSRQFVVFVLVGATCALVDIGLMELLLRSGTAPVPAASVGFAAGLLLNFALHLRVTFDAEWSAGAAWRFAAVVAINYGITVGLVSASAHLLDAALPGKIVSLPLIAVNGFVLSKRWVFT
ncbi:MAG: GtrA family protein [Planctomycetes bacterium]|nr:GtrA family protein [Planctomycetota bacterium]